ncbi:MAG: hypothetical protein CMP67_10165 [Flavobacteriales bacterium]|nr:hypothetical protein [Flavobacteriales bacterium]MBL56295.1 hypothetical protein [Flavobacteriales bacterium]|tara:strand:- start:317 stop:544 length:228 start_codon:yes stop_codon:yes gene_type:complete
MEEKIKIEERFLENAESLVSDLLKQHFASTDCQLDAFTKSKIKGLIKRVIIQEVEYLNQDPENYFSIYGEDHLNN